MIADIGAEVSKMEDHNDDTNTGRAGRVQPTAAEGLFFYTVNKHTANKLDVNWNAVAAEMGLKNGEIARVSASPL
jgi:hypothetical protein